MPQNWNFRLPRGHRFFAKNGSCSYGAKSRWGPLRVYIGANGVPLRPKNGSKRRKLPCPKIRIFDDPAVIDFSQKMEVTVMARNQGGDPLGSILGPMGSHWVQRKSQNCRKLQFRKIRTFDYPAVIHFPKMEVTVKAPNDSGDPLGSILGPMGSHWVQRKDQNCKKLQWRKIRIFDHPSVIHFPKNGSYGYGAKSRWGPPRVHLGANGVPLGKKIGSKP